MKSCLYTHKVNYYETDKMGITHHSNYIRWMEEARVEFLALNNCGYDELEKMGVISPVIGLSCKYKMPSSFNDLIEIKVSLAEYNGVKIVFDYEMINCRSKAIVAIATSEHCFTDGAGRPIIIKRKYPELHEKFMDILNDLC